MNRYYKAYGFLGTIHLIISVVYTKLFIKNARIVRLPFDLRGKKGISIGMGFTAGRGCRLETYDFISSKGIKLHIGKNVQINDYVHITAIKSVVIGNNVLLASRVYISDASHGSYDGIYSAHPKTPPIDRENTYKPVYIGDNVWIGEGVVILPGVQIGFGCIIGANSVVTKSYGPNHIIAGNPARPIKLFNETTGRWEKL